VTSRGSPAGAGPSLAAIVGIRVIAAPDDVDRDYVRASVVSDNSHIGRSACGAKDRSLAVEVLSADARRAPETDTLAEWLTRDPHYDRLPALPVLYPRVVQAGPQKMRGYELPAEGSELLGPGRREGTYHGGQANDRPWETECVHDCPAENSSAPQEC